MIHAPDVEGAVRWTNATYRQWTCEEMFQEVRGRHMHSGARRTWLSKNKRFPGHRIPYKWIVDQVAECGVCQKYRARFENHIEEIYSHLKPPHHRARVGFDGLSVIFYKTTIITTEVYLLSKCGKVWPVHNDRPHTN